MDLCLSHCLNNWNVTILCYKFSRRRPNIYWLGWGYFSMKVKQIINIVNYYKANYLREVKTLPELAISWFKLLSILYFLYLHLTGSKFPHITVESISGIVRHKYTIPWSTMKISSQLNFCQFHTALSMSYNYTYLAQRFRFQNLMKRCRVVSVVLSP